MASVACSDESLDPPGSDGGGAAVQGGGGAAESGGQGGQGGSASTTGGVGGAGGAAVRGPCPGDMVHLEDRDGSGLCMDRFEAPNEVGALPLVMYSMTEAAAWCGARGKRLCRDDEWTAACEGRSMESYPYGDDHVPGQCNDDQVWIVYDQAKLNGWPLGASNPTIESLEELLDEASAASPAGAIAADHVLALYQAAPSGEKAGCVGPWGVYDLCGNVEEWTERSDGGTMSGFTGNLKGRYWAEPRTCQSNVTNHADAFRFYEIGFRCCASAEPPGGGR